MVRSGPTVPHNTNGMLRAEMEDGRSKGQIINTTRVSEEPCHRCKSPAQVEISFTQVDEQSELVPTTKLVECSNPLRLPAPTCLGNLIGIDIRIGMRVRKPPPPRVVVMGRREGRQR
jgi:hypothetical protein